MLVIVVSCRKRRKAVGGLDRGAGSTLKSWSRWALARGGRFGSAWPWFRRAGDGSSTPVGAVGGETTERAHWGLGTFNTRVTSVAITAADGVLGGIREDSPLEEAGSRVRFGEGGDPFDLFGSNPNRDGVVSAIVHKTGYSFRTGGSSVGVLAFQDMANILKFLNDARRDRAIRWKAVRPGGSEAGDGLGGDVLRGDK